MTKGNKTIFHLFKNEDRSNFVNIDTEIFSELNNLRLEEKIKNARHQSFAFSYLWLVSYLWKYSKYSERQIETECIKELLGTTPIEKRVNYIIKRNGLLDEEGYTETTRDFPVTTQYTQEGIKITCLSNLEEDLATSFLSRYANRYSCKKPLQQFERVRKDGTVKPGLMVSKDDVVKLTIEEFDGCMKAGGVNAFYIYAYLKMRSKLIGYSPVKIYLAEIATIIGLTKTTLGVVLKKLSEDNLIAVASVLKGEDKQFAKENRYSVTEKFRN